MDPAPFPTTIAIPAGINPAVIATFQRNFQGVITSEGSMDLSALSGEDRENLSLDWAFYQQTQGVALENLCCRMGNYSPRNDTQRELVIYAERLLNLGPDQCGGLFMHGQTGVGKTHMAVALAKEFMRKGLTPSFSRADKLYFGTVIPKWMDSTVFILDDLNSGYGEGMDYFRKLVLHAYERGGRIFVTSNMDYQDLLNNSHWGISSMEAKAQKARYMDRTQAMFKVIHVDGDSQRVARAWHGN